MYLLVWVTFLEMLIILFTPVGYTYSVDLHAGVGLVMIGLAYYVFRGVKRSECPERVKRITRATLYMAIACGVFGVLLDAPLGLTLSGFANTFVLFVHFSIAIAVITQASATALAYDMWEEKEFLPAAVRAA
jgi:hypothetical protein